MNKGIVCTIIDIFTSSENYIGNEWLFQRQIWWLVALAKGTRTGPSTARSVDLEILWSNLFDLEPVQSFELEESVKELVYDSRVGKSTPRPGRLKYISSSNFYLPTRKYAGKLVTFCFAQTQKNACIAQIEELLKILNRFTSWQVYFWAGDTFNHLGWIRGRIRFLHSFF